MIPIALGLTLMEPSAVAVAGLYNLERRLSPHFRKAPQEGVAQSSCAIGPGGQSRRVEVVNPRLAPLSGSNVGLGAGGSP